MSIAHKFISTMPIVLHSVLGDLTIPSESEDSKEEEKEEEEKKEEEEVSSEDEPEENYTPFKTFL
jgi:5'-deoxynucleotidase YfbR-like HD superfamily hydrolase